jgi:hypothetical protein
MMYGNDEKIEVGIGGEWIANNLHVGDNVMVPTLTDEPFWLMLVDKGARTILESFEDGDKNEWIVDVVVRGYCYEKLQFNSRSYQLQDDKPLVYVFSHLILASKFSMPPTSHFVKGRYVTYELIAKVVEVIMEALKSINLLG